MIVTKVGFSRKILRKVTNIEFNLNMYSGSCADPHGQTDMMKLLGDFCSYVNKPKKTLGRHLHLSIINCLLTVTLKYGTFKLKCQ